MKNLQKTYYYKCKNINTNELILSSKIGLYKEIKNYNANSYFIHYAQLFDI